MNMYMYSKMKLIFALNFNIEAHYQLSINSRISERGREGGKEGGRKRREGAVALIRQTESE